MSDKSYCFLMPLILLINYGIFDELIKWYCLLIFSCSAFLRLQLV